MEKGNSQIRQRLKPYLQALPDKFNYQIVTKALIAVWLFLLGRIFLALLKSSGRVAVTSGDWKFLFTTWQGVCILLRNRRGIFCARSLTASSRTTSHRRSNCPKNWGTGQILTEWSTGSRR